MNILDNEKTYATELSMTSSIEATCVYRLKVLAKASTLIFLESNAAFKLAMPF